MDHDPDLVRDGLVEAAQRFFLRHGYSRVSTAEVAESSGRSKKTLYKHFPTKQALLHAVIVRMGQALQADTLALLGAGSVSPGQRLRAVLERVGAHHASLGAVLFDDLERREPAIYAQARQQERDTLLAFLVALLEAGRAQGVVRTELDVPGTAATFLTSVEALARPGSAGGDHGSPDVLVKTLVGWVLAGIARP